MEQHTWGHKGMNATSDGVVLVNPRLLSAQQEEQNQKKANKGTGTNGLARVEEKKRK